MEGDDMLPGERFCPMEDELIMFYLKPKVNRMQVPGEGDVICEMDLYGDQDPWKIWKDFEVKRANDLRRNKDLYFFTQKKKKTARSSRVSRTVGSGGTWKGQNAGKEVYLLDENQEETTTLLGFKKTYAYRNKNSVHDGGWIMHEFELHKSQVAKKQVNKNDYVLCLLKKKDQEKKRERQQEEVNLDDYVEEDDGDNSDHGFVGEGSQEKRQRVLPPVEADQEQFLQPPFEDQVLQLPPSFEAEQEAVPTPSEDQPVIFLDDENIELQESDFAILENWWTNEFEASPATLEDGQVSVLVDENSGLQQEVAEQQGEENLEQKLDPPSAPGDEMMSAEQFHLDETLVEQMRAEANNVDVENLGDSMDEDWMSSFPKELMNDERMPVMEVEELITTSHAGYSDFDLFEYY